MTTKFLVTAALLGGATLFVWGSLWHVANPLWERALLEFNDPVGAAEFARGQTPGNGIYMAPQGVLMVVNLLPDLSDRMQKMGPSLGIQFLCNVAEALVLSLIVLRLRVRAAGAAAACTGLAALAAGLSTQAANWNWYGYPPLFSLLEVADVAGGWALAGLVVGALGKKMVPAA